MPSSLLPRTVLTPLAFAAAIALLLTGGNLSHAQNDLSAQFKSAGESFKPITDEQLAAAKGEVSKQMSTVERFVRPSRKNGQQWLKFLKWDDLKKALAAEGKPEPRPIVQTYQLLNRDEVGLERKQFRDLSSALRRYAELIRITGQADQTAYYRSQLDRLQKQVEEYRAKPTSQAGFEIGSRLGFLASVGAAPELVKSVRQEFAQPNAYVDVSTSLIAAGTDPIDRHEWVNDCILGTSIRSNTHSVGSVGVASIPSKDKAVLEFSSEGKTYAKSTGHNGPAVIRSSSVTDFTATNRVELTDEAFRSQGASADATTHSKIHSVSKAGGGIGSRLVSRMGTDRANESRPQAERIAASHAEGRIERSFNNEINEELRNARKQYEDEYRRPLERRGEAPESIRFSSDRDSLNLVVTQANSGQLAAAGAPPASPKGDMAMRLHESAVNNYTAILIGGATASQTEAGKDLEFDVKLPDWMKDAWKDRKTEADPNAAGGQAFKPYSLRFREGRPVSVNFVDGKVALTVHISRLKSGDRTFNNWDVTGTYTPELANGGVVLRREGDLEMLPANFDGNLSSRQTAERRNLEEELNQRSAQGRGFPKTIEFEALKPKGDLAKVGPLDLRELVSGDGWLTLAWDRQKSAQ